MARIARVLYLIGLILVSFWLCGNGIVSAQQQWARQQDLERVEGDLAALKAEVKGHIKADYEHFNTLYSIDVGKIGELDKRLAVLESSVSTNTRLLWGVGLAALAQLLHLFLAAFKIEIAKRQK